MISSCLVLLSRSCDRVDWNAWSGWLESNRNGLGLATEWIEIFSSTIAAGKKSSRSCDRVDWNIAVKCIPGGIPGLGLATEWIEINPNKPGNKVLHVSVLRPSGLKCICRGTSPTKWSLGLATEWIEMYIFILLSWDVCRLGLATEWIEIATPIFSANCSWVSVLRPSGLKCLPNTVLPTGPPVSVLRPSGLKYWAG